MIASPGHVWDEGKVTKEPTETEEGIRTYTCTVCGDTYTEAIDKLEPSKDPSQGDDTQNPGGQSGDGSDMTTPGSSSDGNAAGGSKTDASVGGSQTGHSADQSGVSAKTGDANMALAWILVLIAAAGAGSGVLIYRRRKNQA